MDTCKMIAIGVLVLLILHFIKTECDKKNSAETFENSNNVNINEENNEVSEDEEDSEEPAKKMNIPMPFQGDQNMDLSNPQDAHIPLGNCGNPANFVSSNLLPKSDPEMEDMSEFAPDLKGKNFVDSYKFILGSQSQSLRNANYQLRSDPPNPQEAVCPWSNTTIDPEARRQLEIGAGN